MKSNGMKQKRTVWKIKSACFSSGLASSESKKIHYFPNQIFFFYFNEYSLKNLLFILQKI